MTDVDLPQSFVPRYSEGLISCGLQDVEQVRLLLRGDSVLDWRKLAFLDYEHVDQFLQVAGFRKNHQGDAQHLRSIHARAVEYLTQTLNFELCDKVQNLDDVRDLFLWASRSRSALQRDACTVLKTMHIIHYIAAQDLLHKLPVSREELFFRVETEAYRAFDSLKAAGIQISEFAASRKSQSSIFTKLLCRDGPLSNEVHDRLRFRIIVEQPEDLFNVLVELSRSFIPFNYVVPGESHNDLIDLEATLAEEPAFFAIDAVLQDLPQLANKPLNKFSSKNFAVINFIADVPVHVDDLIDRIPDYQPTDGSVIFLLIEIQLVDRKQNIINNTGLGRHELYKERQVARALHRLHGE